MKNDLPIRQTARAAISVCSKSVGAGKISVCFKFMVSDARQNATRQSATNGFVSKSKHGKGKWSGIFLI